VAEGGFLDIDVTVRHPRERAGEDRCPLHRLGRRKGLKGRSLLLDNMDTGTETETGGALRLRIYKRLGTRLQACGPVFQQSAFCRLDPPTLRSLALTRKSSTRASVKRMANTHLLPTWTAATSMCAAPACPLPPAFSCSHIIGTARGRALTPSSSFPLLSSYCFSNAMSTVTPKLVVFTMSVSGQDSFVAKEAGTGDGTCCSLHGAT
jgi:hypothetical protein